MAHSPPGLLARGNIDLRHRPVIHNPDGTYSTIRSITITDDHGRATLIPTVIPNHRGGYYVAGDKEAIAHYRVSGQHLGIFSNEADANAYGSYLHKQQVKHPPVKIRAQ